MCTSKLLMYATCHHVVPSEKDEPMNTHTFAKIEVSAFAFDERTIDMHGIALILGRDPDSDYDDVA